MDVKHTRTLLLCLLLCLNACSALPAHRPEAPIVEIDKVRPLNLSLEQQKLEFTLFVHNPNDYTIVIDELDFIASLNERDVAKGNSRQRTTLPAAGDSHMTVQVAAGLSTALETLGRVLKNDGDDQVGYGIRGTFRLAGWPLRIPFDVVGALDTPLTGPTDQTD